MMKRLRRVDRSLARVEGWFISVFLWLMVVFTFLQVCLRGIYTHGQMRWANVLMGYLDWSEPFVRLLVLWLSFLGASLLTGENKHIKIDLFSTILPERWQPLRDFLLSGVCVLISAIMVKVCVDYVHLEMEFGGRLFLNLPSWIGQLILPIGFAVILFRFSISTIENFLKMIGRPQQ